MSERMFVTGFTGVFNTNDNILSAVVNNIKTIAGSAIIPTSANIGCLIKGFSAASSGDFLLKLSDYSTIKATVDDGVYSVDVGLYTDNISVPIDQLTLLTGNNLTLDFNVYYIPL